MESACLKLQDRCGLNVNLILFCCWMAARGRRLSSVEIQRLRAVVAPWDAQVVTPLRAIRRWLKDHSEPGLAGQEALRRDILQQELAAERLVQKMLVACLLLDEGTGDVGLASESAEAAWDSLSCYVAETGAALQEEDWQNLASIKQAAFPP